MDDHEIAARLRAARASDPVPPAVADRLDAVLAELVAERAASETDTPAAAPAKADDPRVADLTGRRRRATTWLLAAAAVAAIGFGVPAVLDDGGDGADSQTATSDGDGQLADAPLHELNNEFDDQTDPASEPDTKAQKAQGNADQHRLQMQMRSLGFAGTPVRLTDLLPDEQRAVRRAVVASDAEPLTGRGNALDERNPAKGEVPTAALAVCVNPEAADVESNGLVLMQREVAADSDAAAEVRSDRRLDVYRCGADGEFALLTSVTLPPRE